eukprot:2395506-Rhodomonas_salina.2
MTPPVCPTVSEDRSVSMSLNLLWNVLGLPASFEPIRQRQRQRQHRDGDTDTDTDKDTQIHRHRHRHTDADSDKEEAGDNPASSLLHLFPSVLSLVLLLDSPALSLLRVPS